jgi:hypothetical protein
MELDRHSGEDARVRSAHVDISFRNTTFIDTICLAFPVALA